VTSFTTICFSVSISLRSKFPFFSQESDVAVTTGLCLFILILLSKNFYSHTVNANELGGYVIYSWDHNDSECVSCVGADCKRVEFFGNK